MLKPGLYNKSAAGAAAEVVLAALGAKDFETRYIRGFYGGYSAAPTSGGLEVLVDDVVCGGGPITGSGLLFLPFSWGERAPLPTSVIKCRLKAGGGTVVAELTVCLEEQPH